MTVAFLLSLSFLAQASIFGSDDRVSVIPGSALAKGRASAVAMMVPNAYISDGPKGFKSLDTNSLTETWGLCESERFSKMPSFNTGCTGFLIAPDLVLTAGHCAVNTGEIRNESGGFCAAFSWVFDFQVAENGERDFFFFFDDLIYECEKIIHAVHDSEFTAQNKLIFRDDYALVRLKRKVPRTPVKLSNQPVQVAEALSMIGHALGGPQVLSSGRVLSLENQFFRSNLDFFDGNSGSPVFNSRDEVVGILVRGYPDGLVESKGPDSCRIVNRCDDGATRCNQDQMLTKPGAQVHSILNIPGVKEFLN